MPREDGSGLTAEVVAGTIDVAVRTTESPRIPQSASFSAQPRTTREIASLSAWSSDARGATVAENETARSRSKVDRHSGATRSATKTFRSD